MHDEDFTVPVTTPGHDPEPERGPTPPIDIKEPGWRALAEEFGEDAVKDFAQVHNAGWERAHGKPKPPPFDKNSRGSQEVKDYYESRGEDVPKEMQDEPVVYVMRHGSTEMNNTDPKKDLIRGWKDIPLDEKGKGEASKLGDELKDSGIKYIVTSDLKRAEQTAQAIAKATGAEVETDPGLRPWKFGPTIEGKPTADMLARINRLVDKPDRVPPGGESFNQFKKRFIAAFHDALDAHPDETTAIVTHYRGTKLLEAWRATGTDNDTIDRAVFEKYDKDKKPASYDVLDKSGAEVKKEPSPTG
jgi:broad specificity phosphatase PhoE